MKHEGLTIFIGLTIMILVSFELMSLQNNDRSNYYKAGYRAGYDAACEELEEKYYEIESSSYDDGYNYGYYEGFDSGYRAAEDDYLD